MTNKDYMFAVLRKNGYIETEKAIGVDFDPEGFGKHIITKWFPKSQLKFGKENDIGNIPVAIPVWLVRKNKMLGSLEYFFYNDKFLERDFPEFFKEISK